MPENPLLPHRKLRELRTLMQLCRDLDKKTKHTPREAILAATSIHLEPGDLLCTPDSDASLAKLAPKAPKKESGPNGGSLVSPSALETVPIATAAARGLQATGKGVALAFATAGQPAPGWDTALEWAQASEIPLVLAVTDATGGKPSRAKSSKQSPTLDWPTIDRVAKKTKLAVLTVDGEDAVALYRVMQECVIRARISGGPAVIWAVMSPASGPKLSRSQQPIARLERYMSERKISFRG